MKSRPISIILIALACLVAGPLFLTYQIWVRQADPIAAQNAFPSLFVLIALFAFPVGVGVYRVKPWGYFSFLAYAITLVAYFIYEYFTAPLLYNYILLVGAVVLMGAVSFLLQKHITAPYFNPQLRWWDRHPRYRVNIEAGFQVDGDIRRGALLDLSLSGCFATVDSRLIPSDSVLVRIRLLDFQINTIAKVIWCNEDTKNTYGLMFTDLSREDKKALRSILNYLALASGETGPVIDAGVPA